jgi:hypothetical protein
MDRRLRRVFVAVLTLVGFAFVILAAAPPIIEDTGTNSAPQTVVKLDGSAIKALDSLEVKGRASKAGYERSQFGSGWATVNGCDTRNIILYRDLKEVTLGDECTVMSGTLVDPYTATTITFIKGSSDIQIDHVVALSDAWQTGAQALTKALRVQLANDPLELLAVQGDANQQKGDGNAASWLPSHKAFRCQYVARQIAVKQKYTLWVIPAEKQAMTAVLSTCPDEPLPVK